MRIIGGHDYYDSALAYGSDSSVVFVRDKTLEQTKLYGVFEPPNTNVVAKTQRGDIHYLDRMHSYQQKNFDFTMCRVIVAGAQWNGVRYNSHAYNHPTTTKYIWDWQNFLEILDQEKYAILHERASKWYRQNITQQYFGEKPCSQWEINWLADNHCSILTCDWASLYSPLCAREYHWRKNGDNLRDLEFYRVLDAYSAFQRISEWVGGTLANTGNPMVAITDDRIKAHKHGFDRWSFRKLPEKNT